MGKVSIENDFHRYGRNGSPVAQVQERDVLRQKPVRDDSRTCIGWNEGERAGKSGRRKGVWQGVLNALSTTKLEYPKKTTKRDFLETTSKKEVRRMQVKEMLCLVLSIASIIMCFATWLLNRK